MGDRVMSFPNMLAREVLEKGIQNPDLRDEIFIQLIKQVTENPNPFVFFFKILSLIILLTCFV